MAELPGGLLDAVKDYLQMSWILSAKEIATITGYINRGMSYLNEKAGVPDGESLDFTLEEAHRTLLLDYCLYARSHALDEFQDNYLPELIALQNREEVKRYIAEQEETDV